MCFLFFRQTYTHFSTCIYRRSRDVSVILMAPQFVWEAGTFRAALSASVSEDICITILLLTFLCGDAYTHTHMYPMDRQ